MNWLKDLVIPKRKKAIGTAIYEHCCFAGTYPVDCEILERRNWCIDDAEIWEKAFLQTIERIVREKSGLSGYVIRYEDSVLDEIVEQWVEDSYISDVVYNDILESFRVEVKKRMKNGK